jgi:hypothetical protein
MVESPDALDALMPFRWSVAEHGYRWVQASIDAEDARGQMAVMPPEPILTSGVASGGRFPVRVYRPLTEEPDLFRRFAQLRTKIEIIAFANRYGLLGHGRPIARGGPVISGEPLSFWRREIAVMGEAIAFWLPRRPKKKPTARETANRLARLNRRLRDELEPRIAQSGVDGQPRLQLALETLLGALWVQLVRTLEQHKQFRPCRMCTRLVEISRDPVTRGKRPDALYCSNACRQRHWRRTHATTRRRTTR